MPTKIDLTGQKFGRLVVVEEAGRDKRRNILWKCRCDCGNETMVNGTNLRRGTKSCGCLSPERVSESNRIDITGQKFGRLAVIEEAGRSKSGNILWRCVCECGNETTVVGSDLRLGRTQSCGCYKRDRSSETHLGTKSSMEVRIRMSCRHQGIPYDEWEEFVKDKKYCPKFDEACRESCRAKYGHRCFMCDKKQADNKTKTGKVRKLSVHHVDMDKAQCCESNWKLVPLCMKCHPGTHNDEMIARLGYMIKEV